MTKRTASISVYPVKTNLPKFSFDHMPSTGNLPQYSLEWRFDAANLNKAVEMLRILQCFKFRKNLVSPIEASHHSPENNWASEKSQHNLMNEFAFFNRFELILRNKLFWIKLSSVAKHGFITPSNQSVHGVERKSQNSIVWGESIRHGFRDWMGVQLVRFLIGTVNH